MWVRRAVSRVLQWLGLRRRPSAEACAARAEAVESMAVAEQDVAVAEQLRPQAEAIAEQLRRRNAANGFDETILRALVGPQ